MGSPPFETTDAHGVAETTVLPAPFSKALDELKQWVDIHVGPDTTSRKVDYQKPSTFNEWDWAKGRKR